MQTNKHRPVSLLWLLLAAVLMAAYIQNLAHAGGDDIVQSNDMNNQTAGDVATGDVNIAGDRTDGGLGLAVALGDVDINDCLASEQTTLLIVGWQRNEVNPFCMAQYYDSAGLHEAAAHVRCSIPEISELFGADCVRLNTVTYVNVPEPETSRGHEPEDDDHEDYHAEHEELKARLAAVEARAAAAAARRARQAPQQTATPGLTEAQKAALRARLGEE